MTTPHVLYQLPELAGKPFRPANGTEGDLFESAFCDECKRERDHRKSRGIPCMILVRTYAYLQADPEYPKEWIFDPDGWPVCTVFDEVPK